jgi:hypothetical protein
MSMLQHFFPQQRRRFDVNTWMPQSSGVFGGGMSPLEACFMPTMLDIFEPLLGLSRTISRPQQQRWNRPQVRRQRQRQQQQQNVRSKSQTRMIKPSYGGVIGGGYGIQKPMLPKTTVSKEMPQKYRIAIDCCGFNQQNIRTCVKPINGVYHLIVNCCSSGKQSRGVGMVSTEFRRSYTLPRSCDIKKMVKYMCNGVFVIEFPLLEQPVLVKCAKLKPTVVKCQGQKMVTLRVPIPEIVNRANLQAFVKDRDLILRFEYKIQPDTVSRVFCYTKVPLPANCSLNQLKCKLNKKRLLTVCAPVLTTTLPRGQKPTMAKFRCIHIERKLRHRISGKLPLIQKAILGKQQIQKKKISTGGKKPITGKKPSVGKQQIGGKQQISGKQQFGKQFGIPKRSSGVFGALFGKVPETSKQVTGKQQIGGMSGVSGKKTTQVPSKIRTTPEVQKKSTVRPEHLVSGQTPIKKTRSGTNIKKTSSQGKLQGTTTTTKRTGEETKRGGISTSEQLHRIVGSSGSPSRKSPEVERRKSSPEGRKSPVSYGQ